MKYRPYVKFEPKEFVIGARFISLDIGAAGADRGTSYRYLFIHPLPMVVIVIPWQREKIWDAKRTRAEKRSVAYDETVDLA